MSNLTRRQLLGAIGATAVATTAIGLAGCDQTSDEGTNPTQQGKSVAIPDANKVGAMSDYGIGKTFKASAPITFSIMMLSNPAYPYKADWTMLKELTTRTNITLDATVIPIADYNQKRGVMISGGTAPMIIPKVYPPDEEQFVAGGAILPVSDYLDYMPNFKDQLAKWKMDSDINQRRQANGKFYILPGLHQSVWQDYTLAVRTDVLQKLGISLGDKPTWDDIYNMLKKMKESRPGEADFYPMSDRFSTPANPGANNLIGILSSAYGTKAGWNWASNFFDKASGKFVFPGSMPAYKDMLTFLNKLVAEKLLDPESFTQQDAQARQKMANNKSYVISTNAQTLVNESRKDVAAIAGATIAKIPLPIGPMGATLEGSRLENGVVINSKAKDNPNFLAMLQFIDWLWYSDEGKMFAKWGIEGTTYTGKISDGTFKLAPTVNWGGLNPSGTKSLQVDYGFFNGVFVYGGSDQLLNSQFPAAEQEFQKLMNARKPRELAPPAPLTTEEREQASLWETGLHDYVNQNTLKFALGQRPLSEWDAFQTELKGKNVDQYIEVINKAYDRYKQANP